MNPYYVIALALLSFFQMTAVAVTNNTASAFRPGVLPPYLQSPSSNAITICFLTQNAEMVTVAWRPATRCEDKGGEIAATATVIPSAGWTIWKARLTALQPGEYYYYQVKYLENGDDKQTAYFQFCTLDPRATSVRFAEVSGAHTDVETLALLMRWLKPEDFEFLVLLGDTRTDFGKKATAEQAVYRMGEYIRLCNASERPILFVRGNGKSADGFADNMACLLDWSGRKLSSMQNVQDRYYCLRAGPLWLLGFDRTGDGTNQLETFQSQAGWLDRLIDQNAWQSSTWHILLTYQSFYNCDRIACKPWRQFWKSIQDAVGIDVEISGHKHSLWMKHELRRTTEIISNGHQLTQQDICGSRGFSLTPGISSLGNCGPKVGLDCDSGQQLGGVVRLVHAGEDCLRVRWLGSKDGRILTELKTVKKQ